MNLYRVRYQLADYHGERDVWADDAEMAIAQTRNWARSQTSLPMYSDSYRVVAMVDSQ